MEKEEKTCRGMDIQVVIVAMAMGATVADTVQVMDLRC